MALPKKSEISNYLNTWFVDNDTGAIEWYHVKDMLAWILELIGLLRCNVVAVTGGVEELIEFDEVDSADYVFSGQIRNSDGVSIDAIIKSSNFTTTSLKATSTVSGNLHWMIFKKVV